MGYKELIDESVRHGVPTEQQILNAAENAGLWPNTVHSWLPAFKRYHEALNSSMPDAQQGLKQAIEVLREAEAGLECAVARLKDRAVVGNFKTSEVLALESVQSFLQTVSKP